MKDWEQVGVQVAVIGLMKPGFLAGRRLERIGPGSSGGEEKRAAEGLYGVRICVPRSGPLGVDLFRGSA